MDETRGAVAAMTMVGGDHFFLDRWVRYYGDQLGRENLFVLSHGGDPEHSRIAEGCNVIYLPLDPTRNCFNQRRWQMLSLFAGGFTHFYNWVITGDVDEIVAVDPALGTTLPQYLASMGRRPPKVITPFAIEMVHHPELEPEPLSPDRNVLDVRRIFRLNANYAKPCLTRIETTFMPGGHYATHDRLHLDPHLYLFHLRFIDHDMTRDRLTTRREQRTIQSGALGEVERAKTGWYPAWDTYRALIRQKPIAETVDFPEFRQEMIDGWRLKKQVFWAPGGARPPGLYRLPERFATLF